jgi:hypothetical protein
VGFEEGNQCLLDQTPIFSRHGTTSVFAADNRFRIAFR